MEFKINRRKHAIYIDLGRAWCIFLRYNPRKNGDICNSGTVNSEELNTAKPYDWRGVNSRLKGQVIETIFTSTVISNAFRA